MTNFSVIDNPARTSSFSEKFVLALFFLILSIFVLSVQNHKVGFGSGPHGWITSHTLAIISHARAANAFVGYSLQIKNESGEKKYDYFDRNPVLFSALMNALLELPDLTISQKVYLARQTMNLIFLATIWVAFLLMRRILGDTLWALSATLMTFSGHYYLYYKDMVHFEQPGLFGFTLLLYSIYVYTHLQRRGFLYCSAVLAVSLGRGYSSLAVLALWLGIELWIVLKSTQFRPIVSARKLVKTDALKILILCGGLSAVYVGYNVVKEADLRRVGVAETSIVDSAMRRLGLIHLDDRAGVGPEDESYEARTSWNNYLPRLGKHAVYAAIPYGPNRLTGPVLRYVSALGVSGILLILGLGAFLIVSFSKYAGSKERCFYVLLALSGFAWLVPMKHHAAFHAYPSIYHAGLLLLFYAAIISKLPRKIRFMALPVAVAVFVISNLSVNKFHSAVAERVNIYTSDFERIVDQLRPGDHVHIDGGYWDFLDQRPYALGFYLSEQYLTPISLADYVISKNRDFASENLTEANEKVFLFPVSIPNRRHPGKKKVEDVNKGLVTSLRYPAN